MSHCVYTCAAADMRQCASPETVNVPRLFFHFVKLIVKLQHEKCYNRTYSYAQETMPGIVGLENSSFAACLNINRTILLTSTKSGRMFICCCQKCKEPDANMKIKTSIVNPFCAEFSGFFPHKKMIENSTYLGSLIWSNIQ